MRALQFDRHLPREACPMCGHDNYGRRRSAGKGRLIALMRFGSDFGNDSAVDTIVCLVELDERFQALGRCASNARIGDRMVIRDLTENIPVFDSDRYWPDMNSEDFGIAEYYKLARQYRTNRRSTRKPL